MADNQIRFIDLDYNTLFSIPDGGNIVITRPGGEQQVRTCQFIDETHMRVGNYDYYICEFAERMQQLGATYAPEIEPEIIAGYHIIDRCPAGDVVIKLGHNPRAVQPWVTWQGYPNKPGDVDLGHYYTNRRDAETDLRLRTQAKLTGKPYEPYAPKPQKRGAR